MSGWRAGSARRAKIASAGAGMTFSTVTTSPSMGASSVAVVGCSGLCSVTAGRFPRSTWTIRDRPSGRASSRVLSTHVSLELAEVRELLPHVGGGLLVGERSRQVPRDALGTVPHRHARQGHGEIGAQHGVVRLDAVTDQGLGDEVQIPRDRPRRRPPPRSPTWPAPAADSATARSTPRFCASASTCQGGTNPLTMVVQNQSDSRQAASSKRCGHEPGRGGFPGPRRAR